MEWSTDIKVHGSNVFKVVGRKAVECVHTEEIFLVVVVVDLIWRDDKEQEGRWEVSLRVESRSEEGTDGQCSWTRFRVPVSKLDLLD
jgi:hypothetical protein